MRRLLRWLREPELIGADDCPLMKRWTIFAAVPEDPSDREKQERFTLFLLPVWLCRDRKLMIHRFEPNVEDRDPHDHPRSFWTFVLRGRYYDLVPCGMCKARKVWGRRQNGDPSPCHYCEAKGVVVGEEMKAGGLRFRPAEHTHSTKTEAEGAWTLVLMGPFERPWGFRRDGVWWSMKEYGSRFGFARVCPSDEEREGAILKYGDGMVEPGKADVPETVTKTARVGTSSMAYESLKKAAEEETDPDRKAILRADQFKYDPMNRPPGGS